MGEAITRGEETDWTARPDGRKAGVLILGVTGLVSLGAFELCNLLLWKKGIAGDAYVPDSSTCTVLFLASVFLSTLGVYLFIPPSKPAPPK